MRDELSTQVRERAPGVDYHTLSREGEFDTERYITEPPPPMGKGEKGKKGKTPHLKDSSRKWEVGLGILLMLTVRLRPLMPLVAIHPAPLSEAIRKESYVI